MYYLKFVLFSFKQYNPARSASNRLGPARRRIWRLAASGPHALQIPRFLLKERLEGESSQRNPDLVGFIYMRPRLATKPFISQASSPFRCSTPSFQHSSSVPSSPGQCFLLRCLLSSYSLSSKERFCFTCLDKSITAHIHYFLYTVLYISSEMNTEGNGQSVLSTLPKELPLDFLRTITNQFSEDRVLGTGAFGTVYTVCSSRTILYHLQSCRKCQQFLKRLAENAPLPRDKAITNEVQNIMALKHDNIVKLVGFCHEGQKKVVLNNGRYIVADVFESLLCYEYLPKGSLQKNHFGR